ncbi:MAG: DNA mismatch repair protein MutS [Methanoregulaceae archaeon]|nr:DNA mismatch repair protein MutS [Methanoregulaceae archaeon]
MQTGEGGRTGHRLTPAMAQYAAIKARYPGTILFFHIGDFYETFGEDAETVSKELDLVLTSRGRDGEGRKIPLAGVPYHAAEGYIARLVNRGYRVAICDQVGDTKPGRGLVEREVVRVITPGTATGESLLDTPRARYLMALVPEDESRMFGLAFLDVSTGEFFATSATIAELPGAIASYRPSECVAPHDLPGRILGVLRESGMVVTPMEDRAFELGRADALLKEQFGTDPHTWCDSAPSPVLVRAAGAALQYAIETQMAPLGHIRGLSIRNAGDCMLLDACTLRNLEILTPVGQNGRDTSLRAALDGTRTPMGSRMLSRMLTEPLRIPESINARLNAVGYLCSHSLASAELGLLLKRCADIERIAGRIACGALGPREAIALSRSLETMPAIRTALEDIPAGTESLLGRILEGIIPRPDIVALIGRAVADDPPALARNGGMIRQGYDTALDRLREITGKGKEWIGAFQARERERTGIRSLKVGYNSVFGYYIEVTKPNLGLVPRDYERKQTTSTGERFTTGPLKEMEAEIATADERIRALEAELYAAFVRDLQAAVPDLQNSARAIGELDVYTGFAGIAGRYNYVRPAVTRSARILIREGRHPVVERHMAGRFVPNDACLDAGGDQILILTGANMAGKSTFMRAIALITLMAQAGSFVPAAHAEIGIVDRIFTRVGAFDDLASGQSTFMVEMTELAMILTKATDQSLVVLDEIGRGTSTLDGGAIARAVLEHLHGSGRTGPRTLFATHFHDIVDLAATHPRMKNFHFAVEDNGKELVFLRKIVPGATDRSYGIHVAALAGVPPKVTERAAEILAGMTKKPSAGTTGKRYTQTFLFGGARTSGTGGRPVSENEDRVLQEIRNIAPDSMTPLEALTLLAGLKERLNKGDQ